jgi:predicted DNA-binding protein with PD1-like motif
MECLPIRLSPGADLRRALEATLAERGLHAAFVVAGIGSLVCAKLRYASETDPVSLDGPLELLGLSGSLATEGAHLHMAVSDASGRVSGGHVSYGSIVRTTAEILVAVLPAWSFAREYDAASGFRELVIRRQV